MNRRKKYQIIDNINKMTPGQQLNFKVLILRYNFEDIFNKKLYLIEGQCTKAFDIAIYDGIGFYLQQILDDEFYIESECNNNEYIMVKKCEEVIEILTFVQKYLDLIFEEVK